MMDDAELIARLRGWVKDIQEGSEAIWAMDQDLKEAADRIEALVAERDAARDAALEEAAKVAEGRHAAWQYLGAACLVDDDISACSDIAAAIRALKGKSQ